MIYTHVMMKGSGVVSPPDRGMGIKQRFAVESCVGRFTAEYQHMEIRHGITDSFAPKTRMG